MDILINNAGILRDISFKNMKDEDWDLINKVHTYGAYKVGIPFSAFGSCALSDGFLDSALALLGLTSGNKSTVVSLTRPLLPVSSVASVRPTTRPPSSVRSVLPRPWPRRVPSTTSLPTSLLPLVCAIPYLSSF